MYGTTEQFIWDVIKDLQMNMRKWIASVTYHEVRNPIWSAVDDSYEDIYEFFEEEFMKTVEMLDDEIS